MRCTALGVQSTVSYHATANNGPLPELDAAAAAAASHWPRSVLNTMNCCDPASRSERACHISLCLAGTSSKHGTAPFETSLGKNATALNTSCMMGQDGTCKAAVTATGNASILHCLPSCHPRITKTAQREAAQPRACACLHACGEVQQESMCAAIAKKQPDA